MEMTKREKTVQFLADCIEQAIKETQPEVCCYGRWDKEDDDDNVIGKRIGYDGAFDLMALADALLDKIT